MIRAVSLWLQAYKNKGEKYKVLWPEREEFVRMAARFGATIVPVAAIGCEDAVTMLADAQDIKRIPILGERVAKNARETIPQARRCFPSFRAASMSPVIKKQRFVSSVCDVDVKRAQRKSRLHPIHHKISSFDEGSMLSYTERKYLCLSPLGLLPWHQ